MLCSENKCLLCSNNKHLLYYNVRPPIISTRPFSTIVSLSQYTCTYTYTCNPMMHALQLYPWPCPTMPSYMYACIHAPTHTHASLWCTPSNCIHGHFPPCLGIHIRILISTVIFCTLVIRACVAGSFIGFILGNCLRQDRLQLRLRYEICVNIIYDVTLFTMATYSEICMCLEAGQYLRCEICVCCLRQDRLQLWYMRYVCV